MPIYEFQCDACGHQFEKLQKLNDAIPVCPVCTKSAVRKLISSGSFQLKGSGWYKSDYKNSGKAAEDKKSDVVTDGKDSKKSDSDGSDSGTTKAENKTDVTNKSSVKDAA